MIESFDYQKYGEQGIKYLNENFNKKTVQWWKKNSNIMAIKPYISDFIKTVDYQKRDPVVSDIDAMLDDGMLVSVTVNSGALNAKGKYSSHMILIYDHGNNRFTFHDPGLPAVESRQEKKDLIIKAMGDTSEVTGFKFKRSKGGA